MTTPLSITSRSQGQIFGAKPSLENMERQLEADPMTRFMAKLVHAFVLLASGFHAVHIPMRGLKSNVLRPDMRHG